MENKRTKSKAAKMFSLLNTGDRAFLQWEASVRKNKTFKTFFGGGNIKQTFSAIVVPDFLCGYGAYLAVWCVLLW